MSEIKKITTFLGLLGINLICYTTIISIYARVNPALDFFSASCVLAATIPLTTVIATNIPFKRGPTENIALLLCCAQSIFIFATFGPVFIDRSISYHLAFYAAQNETINTIEFKQKFSDRVFDKRFIDAVNAGLLIKKSPTDYAPTDKAKTISNILMDLGMVTNSLQSYDAANGAN